MSAPNTIVNTDLAGFTVTYNGVQFGAANAPGILVPAGIDDINGNVFKAAPPMYALASEFRYDDSRRTIIGIDHLLTVRTIIFEASEDRMAANMTALRILLGQPGKVLKIQGLGTGFGKIEPPALDANYSDLDSGPHPLKLDCQPIGNMAWEMTFVIKFFISECESEETDLLAWIAFNFSTTWQNDFEGISSRTISGYIQIAQIRGTTNPFHVADEVRGNLIVAIPPNFRRVQNVWQESADKSRLAFTIVDEQLPGDILPTGVTAANGVMSFTADGGPNKASMVHGVATFSMTIRTAPNQPKNLAGRLFIIAALNKQIDLTTDDDGNHRAGMTVIPIHFSISNSKFDQSRETTATIAWLLTGTLSKNLAACNLWQSVNDTLLIAPIFGLGAEDGPAWQASMVPMWDNRGTAQLASQASEAKYINWCNNQLTGTIGVNSGPSLSISDATLPSLACPSLETDEDDNVLPTAGWLYYKLEVELNRTDHQTTHRKAVNPTLSNPASPSPGVLPGPVATQSASDEHVAERHGYPTVYVAVKYAMLRYGAKCIRPQLGSVGGVTVNEATDYVGGKPGSDEIAFDVFGCKVYRLVGHSVYRLRGIPSGLTNPVGTILTTTDPLDPSQKLSL